MAQRESDSTTYNTGVEKMKKTFGTCGRPQQGIKPPQHLQTLKIKFSVHFILFRACFGWHPHHVPAMDDAAGTETPAALTRNVCHAYAAVCRSMPGSRSTLWPGTRQHAPVFSPARRAKGEGADFVKVHSTWMTRIGSDLVEPLTTCRVVLARARLARTRS